MLKIYKNKIYKLTKIKIKDSHHSSIPVGYTQQGKASLIHRSHKMWVHIQGKKWNDALSTSPITNIIRHIKGYELETETSIYLLEVVNEKS